MSNIHLRGYDWLLLECIIVTQASIHISKALISQCLLAFFSCLACLQCECWQLLLDSVMVKIKQKTKQTWKAHGWPNISLVNQVIEVYNISGKKEVSNIMSLPRLDVSFEEGFLFNIWYATYDKSQLQVEPLLMANYE